MLQIEDLQAGIRETGRAILVRHRTKEMSLRPATISGIGIITATAMVATVTDAGVFSSPRVVTGPILLTDLAVCASCGGGMTLRTGTSRNGVAHRYYTCSACARSGKAACKGRSIRMGTLDHLVVEYLSERLFTTERLTEMLASIGSDRAEKAAEVDGRIVALQRKATEAEETIGAPSLMKLRTSFTRYYSDRHGQR